MSFELGMLVLRLVVGGLMFGHGAQKLFGWFGGYGLAGVGGFFESKLRLRPGKPWAFLAGVSEAGGGLLLALGLLTPLGSIGIIAAMVMAIILSHWGKLWAQDGGSEYPLVLIAASLAVALAGPGAWSLDAIFDISLPMPITLIAGLILALVGVAAGLASRASAEAEPQRDLQRAA
ncbi:MAG TPA: DoxX family protein [Chloroflexota bacterium]|jgi:putative oxidoreductase|nr:DoxX family protein [Chloroflexota bacterium]